MDGLIIMAADDVSISIFGARSAVAAGCTAFATGSARCFH